ncbi:MULTISPECIES: TRAP transporter small permease [Marinomonas]|uniref:TRAP transporter small permease protein n=1 Tax=Marinomonas arctica TaxID=383750 RepID=A0A7H1J7P4_9GAMM|nr:MULTISPECIES: TRAP transporter small permease [Marinomonas]QNT06510.1 TRAP transporter small permease [Marinomonas arctica]
MLLLIRIITLLGRLNSALILVFKYLAIGAVAIMTTTILVQVFCRYVLNDSLPWSEELARYLMVWMTFLMLPVVSRTKQHAALDIILGSLPKRLSLLLELVLYVLVGIVLYYAFNKSLDFALKGTRMLATALPITKAWSYMAMPVGFGVMMLVYTELFLIGITRLFNESNGDKFVLSDSESEA